MDPRDVFAFLMKQSTIKEIRDLTVLG
jgi:hypothetical protein